MIRALLTRWASRYLSLTVAGRLPVVSNADELDRLIAERHRNGDAARKGWQSRRAR